jgi:hypothetical protein
MIKPPIDEVPEFYQNYIRILPDEIPLLTLLKDIQDSYNLLGRLSNAEAAYRYQMTKWSIKQLTAHLIDSERIFCNRALRFARADQTELPGFDQDHYVENSKADSRDWGHLINEFDAVRSSTLYMFESFNEDQLNRTGTANGFHISVNSIGYIIAGHQQHHLSIIHERYLIK